MVKKKRLSSIYDGNSGGLRFFISVYFILTCLVSGEAFAQFEATENDLIEEVKTPADEQQSPSQKNENPVTIVPEETFNKPEITHAEIKKLTEAKKSNSESSIVKAAAEILSKDPHNAQALNTLAVFYFETKKYGLAKIILRRALKEHPEEPALHNNLGIVYLAEKDMRLALESFKKSVQAKSGYRVGATNLSAIYLKYADYKRSLNPLEEAYEATHSDLRRGTASAVEIANNYGVALLGVGEDAKARKVFEEIMGAGPRNPVPYLNYAILLIEVQKKKKDAIRVISKLKFMTEDREILRRVHELEKKME